MAVSFIGAGSITDDLVGAASFTVTAPTCAINDNDKSNYQNHKLSRLQKNSNL